MFSRSLVKAHGIAARIRAERGAGSMRCEAAQAGARGELFLYGIIGDFWGEGITARGVADALAALKGVTALDIRMSSEGGDIFEAAAIYTLLARFPAADRVVHVDGIAASAATFVAMAGSKVVMSPAATWMVHNPWTFAVGDAGELRSVADRLDLEAGIIAGRYAEKTGKPVDRMRELMTAETWLNAEQTVAEGFADEVAAVVDQKDDDPPKDSALSRFLVAAHQHTHELASPAAVLNAKAQMRALSSRGAGPASSAAGRGHPAAPNGAPKS